MSHPPESPHPLGADAPREDHVGLAFRALGFSIALGTALAALAVFVVRTLQQSAPPSAGVDFSAAPAMVLLGGTLVALIASALATWRLLAPTRSPYRQGMLAIVSSFATLVMAMITQPIDRMFGRSGLLAVTGIALVIALVIGRQITRLRAAA